MVEKLGGLRMKIANRILASLLLAVMAFFTSTGASTAGATERQALKDYQTTIKKATAMDKVYLFDSQIKNATLGKLAYIHYSHQSHSSHTSHYSSSF